MKLLLIIVGLFPALCYAQFQQPGGNPLQNQAVLKSDTAVGKDQLYGSVLRWIATTYGSGKAVIDLADQASGIIIAKPIMKSSWKANFVNTGAPMTISYTLQIEVKPGRIRVTSSGYRYSNDATPTQYRVVTDNKHPFFRGYGSKMMQREWDAAQNAIENDWNGTVTGLQNAINVKGAGADW